MERPRLRPLEAYPVTISGRPHLKLRDPSRVSEAVATLTPQQVAIVELLDGELTRDQIVDELYKRRKQQITRASLDALVSQLDDALLLDSDKFRQHSANMFAEFGRSPTRSPLFAGASYPNDPKELAASLDGYFKKPRGPGKPTKENGARPKALIAPHVDFQRGGAAYAWAYQPLAASAADPPDLVVVIGTDHNGGQPFTLTRKHYETPLGRIDTDTDLVDKLVAEAGGPALYRDEHHHRGEHTIEFQAVWLKHIYGERASQIKLLPILSGSLHDYVERGGEAAAAKATAPFLNALTESVKDRKVLWIAAADLAHVGPRYGDREPLDDADKASLEKRDRETLAFVEKGDARGWFEELRKERDRRRVCGLSCIYEMLKAAQPGEGRVAVYAQCAAEQGSIVSIASVIF